MMLATWLVEFYLSKYDELDDLTALSSAQYDVENVKTERSILEEDLRRFLESHKVGPTSEHLLQSHSYVDLRMTSSLTQYTN
jgi:vacuolar protein sorting-associated protein 18